MRFGLAGKLWSMLAPPPNLMRIFRAFPIPRCCKDSSWLTPDRGTVDTQKLRCLLGRTLPRAVRNTGHLRRQCSGTMGGRRQDYAGCAAAGIVQDDRYAIRIWFAKELHAEVNTLSLIVRVSQAAAAGLAQRLS